MPLINITIPSHISAFMDESRHYNPAEIDTLSMLPNTNGEITYYVDGTNGSNNYTGKAPVWDGISSTSAGPFLNISKAMSVMTRFGQRLLIRTGWYKTGFYTLSGSHWGGTPDSAHTVTFAPYGDGEVVIDMSETRNLGTFVEFAPKLWRASDVNIWGGRPIKWAILDYNARSCREADGYVGVDDSAVNGKSFSLVDTTKNFVNYVHTNGSGSINLVGAFVVNTVDNSWGIVTSISTTVNANDTLNFVGGLTSGARNNFNSGDSYAVWIGSQDGYFFSAADNFYIYCVTGNPTSRNLIANPDDRDNSKTPTYITTGQGFVHLYGLSMVGAPSLSGYVLGTSMNVTFEKCRFLFSGKTSMSVYGSGTHLMYYLKNFIYGAVMLNWPMGRTYGGNGGWPNSMNNSGRSQQTFGNIIFDSFGEGMQGAIETKDNIVSDVFSMGIYQGYVGAVASSVHNNVVIYSGYIGGDILSNFYLSYYYNGWQRTYVKHHHYGIVIEAEAGQTAIENVNIYNNLIIGCWQGISGYFESGTNGGFRHDKLLNNTIIMPFDEDLILKMYGPAYGISLSTGVNNYDNIVANNIIIGANNADGRKLLIAVSGTTYSSYSVYNNLYSFPGYTNVFNASGSKNFTDWKALTGYDSGSIFTDSPLLEKVDWTTMAGILKNDLRLTLTSPAVNVGTNFDSVFTIDYDSISRPRGSQWDLGAFEYEIPSGQNDLTCRVEIVYGRTNIVLVCRVTAYVDDYLNHCKVNVLQQAIKSLVSRVHVITTGHLICRTNVYRESSKGLVSRVISLLDSSKALQCMVDSKNYPYSFLQVVVSVLGLSADVIEGRVAVRRFLLKDLQGSVISRNESFSSLQVRVTPLHVVS